jgi:hypothetical protein
MECGSIFSFIRYTFRWNWPRPTLGNSVVMPASASTAPATPSSPCLAGSPSSGSIRARHHRLEAVPDLPSLGHIAAHGRSRDMTSEAARLRKARYRRSAKGKAAASRYKRSAKGKAAQARYGLSEKGKAAAKRYRARHKERSADAPEP